MAIMTRCRIPPDIWCGYSFARRPGSGMRTTSMRRAASRSASFFFIILWTMSPSAIW